MTGPSIDRQCPYCGEWTAAAIPRCQACGEVKGGRRVPPVDRPVQAEDFIIPRNVSLWSMLACYIGLLGCILPVIGIPFSVLAIVFAIIALRNAERVRPTGQLPAISGRSSVCCSASLASCSGASWCS